MLKNKQKHKKATANTTVEMDRHRQEIADIMIRYDYPEYSAPMIEMCIQRGGYLSAEEWSNHWIW